MTKLSDSQLVVLAAACGRDDRSVYPLTITARGMAAEKVLKSLLAKGLIGEVEARTGETVWRAGEDGAPLTLRATRAADVALGIEDDAPAPQVADAGTQEREAGEAAAPDATADEATPAEPAAAPARKVREGTKQALLIDLLRRPDGATIAEVVQETGWQPHYADARIMPM